MMLKLTVLALLLRSKVGYFELHCSIIINSAWDGLNRPEPTIFFGNIIAPAVMLKSRICRCMQCIGSPKPLSFDCTVFLKWLPLYYNCVEERNINRFQAANYIVPELVKYLKVFKKYPWCVYRCCFQNVNRNPLQGAIWAAMADIKFPWNACNPWIYNTQLSLPTAPKESQELWGKCNCG